MSRFFEYRVCAAQNNRITFVNGNWMGDIAPTAEDPNLALDSCPTMWEYLQTAGAEGWELSGAVDQPVGDVHVVTLFLKRER